MKKKCEYDGVEFNAKRADARFCPPPKKCRQYAAKKAGVNPDTGEILVNGEVTDEYPNGAAKSILVRNVKVRDETIDWKRYEDPNDPLYEPNPFKRPGDPTYDKKKALKAFQKMGLEKVTWISTGIEQFDQLTKIPRGRITQIQGPYGVGKTTLCLNMIRGMRGSKILYIDTEASLNPDLLVELQTDDANFNLYNKSAYLEDVSEIIEKAAKSGDYDVVILDSLASLTTKAETEGAITDRNIGQKAFFTHKLIRLTQMAFKNTNTAFVVVNQEREVIGSYVPQKYTPGGNAVPYAASLIIALKTIKSWRFPIKPKDGIYLGQEVEATIIKSKVNTPWRTSKFKLYYPNPVVDDTEAF